MKYLKEVCEVCGKTEETPISQITRGTAEKMDSFYIAINSGVKMDNIAETRNCLCGKCIESAKKEIKDLLEKSKYFELINDNLF